MAGFSELIRNFDKVRDYMRDFFVYGFRTREDFSGKSNRTYDNEKRRIESYLGDYIKWDYSKKGKHTFISLDASKIETNPLYSAWKSKSFTNNDIILHFHLLDILSHTQALPVPEITERIINSSGHIFDNQTVRNKCVEYVKNGLLHAEKKGRSVYYCLSSSYFNNLIPLPHYLKEAVMFFQSTAPLGEIGSFIMDNEGFQNNIFTFKHHYIVHTLEDGILMDLLSAIRQKHLISFDHISGKTNKKSKLWGVPLKVFVSAATGRRYLCAYNCHRRRFGCHRLDYILSVEQLAPSEDYDILLKKLTKALDKTWGVNFGGKTREEILCMKLKIDEERESYVIDRILREGRGGELLRIEKNIFLYTKTVFDTNELSPWIKTFVGRIIALEGTNQTIIDRFYNDIKTLGELYQLEEA